MARGELDLHAGFMQGRIKVVGPMGRFMAVLPATQSSEHRAAVRGPGRSDRGLISRLRRRARR